MRCATITHTPPVVQTQGAAHWLALLRSAAVPCAPIYAVAQIFEDAQIRQRGLVKTVSHPLSGTLDLVGNPLNFSATPIEYLRPPPLLGEHTAQLLRELLGLDAQEIEALERDRVTAA